MHEKKCKSAAPTGTAAANVEIERTDVAAATLHSLFDLDVELKSKLDFARTDHEKVKQLMELDVLLLDEVSMCICKGANAPLLIPITMMRMCFASKV